MTYRELRDILNNLVGKEWLDADVTMLLMDSDEVMPVMDFVIDWKTEKKEKGVEQVEGVLDDGHPYFTVAY